MRPTQYVFIILILFAGLSVSGCKNNNAEPTARDVEDLSNIRAMGEIHQLISKEAWSKADLKERSVYVNDIITNQYFKSKSRNEVLDFLGTPEHTANNNSIIMYEVDLGSTEGPAIFYLTFYFDDSNSAENFVLSDAKVE